MDIGEKIKARRKELGKTLEEVGAAVGVGKSTVRKWEQGMIKNMRRDKIALLAAALDLDPADLIEYGSASALSLSDAEMAHLHPINPNTTYIFVHGIFGIIVRR